jgi:hypothetical protein
MIAYVIGFAGLEGHHDNATSLNSDLSQEKSAEFEQFGQNLSSFVYQNPAEVDSTVNEIRGFISLLEELHEGLTKRKDSEALLNDSIRAYLFNDPILGLEEILIGLQIKHFGFLLRFCRKLVGVISYQSLRLKLSQSQASSEVHEPSTQAANIYQPYVSEYWRDLIENLPVASDRKACKLFCKIGTGRP